MNLNELGTTPLTDGVDVNNLPEQFGGFTPPPPPGTYRFQLPVLKPEAFSKVITEKEGDRVKVTFNDDFPLLIIQAPPAAKDYEKTPFNTNLTNTPRKRGKGDDAPKASDWDYLNKALGEPARPANNADYAKKLIAQSQTAGGKTFQADVEWGWSCNPNRAARFDDGNGQFIEVPQTDGDGAPMKDPNTGEPIPVKGCGKRYYEGQVDKVDGKVPLRITCECGANVRAFPNLTRFK